MTKKNDAHGLKKILSNNWFIFKYAYHIAPVYALMVCLNTALHSVIVFFEHTYMMKYLIDCIQYKRPFIYAALYILGVFITVSSWIFFNNLFETKYRKKYQEKLHRRLQFDVYEKARNMDLDCYDNPEFYNDFVWAMSESLERTDAVLNSIKTLFQSIATILTCGVFMITTDVFGLVFVALSFFSTFYINTRINKQEYELNVELRPMQRKRDYIGRVFYLSDFAKEIRLSDVKNKLFKDYDNLNDSINETIKKRTKKLTFLSFLSEYVCQSFILDGLYMIYLLFRAIVVHAISYGSMVGLFRSSSTLSGGLRNFTRALPMFQENSLYIEKLLKFLNYENKITNKNSALKMPEALSPLTLENVGFSYQGTSEPILKNINMTIKPHEKIAIVGHNGAGKTTLINLLMRLYDVNDGEILYNDINIKEYDLKSYRDGFGAVFQDYQLFAATIANNVTMDNIENSNEKVINALKQSGFCEKLNLLNDGLDTVLTREFDDSGTDLSGGESQKIAIARVFYKNCHMIILDEPSSALDPMSEYYLNRMISETAKDKTVIFISHRLSTTRMADRIYMLEKGEIIEQGSHQDLMELNGKYAYMFNLQAKKYRSTSNAVD